MSDFMYTVPSTKAKQHFGEVMDNAREYPVMITKRGREDMVIMSAKYFKKLQHIIEAAEDEQLGRLAEEILKKNEWLSLEESAKVHKEMLNAGD